MKNQNNCESDECDRQPCPISLELPRRQFLIAASAAVAGVGTGPLLASPQRASESKTGQSYADTIQAHESLRGYWRCDGNLVDVMGKASMNGKQSYVEGATSGRAVKFAPQASVATNATDHLRGRSATVEFFFKLTSTPTGQEHAVLISQTNGQQVRYITGVKNDLSGLIYQNAVETVQTTINLPTNQPIEIGRWYHFAMTGFDLDLRAYVDGYECSLTGGAFEFTRRGPKKSSMTLGQTSVKGWGSSEIALDEIACYAGGLAESDFQDHLKAAGWGARLKATGEVVAKVRADRDANRAAKAEAMMSDPALTASGSTRVYEGQNLEAISFIVGGIGAGGIQFNGKARPAIWQIACNHRELNIDSLLAIRAQREGGQPIVRALQTEAVDPFAAMPSLKFEGEYPFAKYRFEEPALPVEVELEVFNPFIPMDLKNCAIPCAIYNVTLTNSSSVKANVDLLAAQQNGLGFHEGKNGSAKFANNLNRIVNDGDATMLHMTRQSNDSADMVLMTQAAGAKGSASFESNAALHETFATDGICDGPGKSYSSPRGKTVSGALTVPVELAPGESKSVTFVLTWHFKEGRHGDNRKIKIKLAGESEAQTRSWSHRGQNYTNWWPNAMAVAQYMQENLGELTERTRRFHDTLYASNLPVWLLDRFSSQLAVLRSQTCWWAADGYFGAWEGCNPTKGCCPGNCTHVWHYAQGHARLLPELGRKMREQDYATELPDGLLPHRHNNKNPAADGHFGTILNTYREHLCSTDNEWLKSQWPKTKRVMDWGIKHWNPKRDGFLQKHQHNTLDGGMTGCSSWIGGLYLSALEAGARMAEVMGEAEVAKAYRRIRTSGKKMQNDRLWNGEYYIQEVGEQRDQDYLDGCHIDQLLGEWWGDQVGIDRNFPADRSKIAMQSLLKHNFLTDFHGQSLKPRQYCESTDGGMKMITWPKNAQPIPGMKYGDEVMTGFEYGAAATLIQNGLLKEGLMVIKIISDRYDGRLRTEGVSDFANGPWGYSGNPFGDDECGKFYGRSLSVWSALLSLQGFIYDGPAGVIGFRPRMNAEDHASFFSAAEGYGLFKQVIAAGKLNAAIEVAEGTVRLNQIVLAAGEEPKSVSVSKNGEVIEVNYEMEKSDVHLTLHDAIELTTGDRVEIELM